jgi:hypothetical protein
VNRDEVLAEFASLFNRGAFFEAHEVLESLWRQEPCDLYKGWIQAAVAYYHLGRGNLMGARKVLASAQRYLRGPVPARWAGTNAALLQRLERDAAEIEAGRHPGPPPRLDMG